MVEKIMSNVTFINSIDGYGLKGVVSEWKLTQIDGRALLIGREDLEVQDRSSAELVPFSVLFNIQECFYAK